MLNRGWHLTVEIVVVVQGCHHAVEVALVYEVDGVVVDSMMEVDVGTAAVDGLKVVSDVIGFQKDDFVHCRHCDQRSIQTRNDREEVKTRELYKNHVVKFKQGIGPKISVTDGSGGGGYEIEGRNVDVEPFHVFW